MEVEMSDDSGASTPAVTPFISQRIVSVDSYTYPPNYLFDQVKNDFNNTELHWVPVIRIFGSTTGGQKTCAHIHGVFPYMYVPALPTVDEKELADRIDVALNRASNFTKKENFKHVMQIVKVKGKSYYGYHNSDQVFFKIYFYSPFSVTKAAQLLANGSIMDVRLQPHESHIPYILQFFIDYNLFGMNLVHYRKVLFRRNEGQKEFLKSFRPDEPREHWSYDEMGEHLFQPESVKRMARCELEFDVVADDILNRLEKRTRNSNPGIGAIWQDEMERRRKLGLADWANIPIPESQDREYKGEIFEAEQLHRRTLLKKLEPFSYLSKLPSERALTETCTEDLIPASQSDTFLPQEESQVSFSAKYSQSQDVDDESVLKLFQEMAEEVRKEEAHYMDHSILHAHECEDIEKTDDSDKVAQQKNGQHSEEEGEEDGMWSQSFMSTTLEDLEILDPPLTTSGAARTDPVSLHAARESSSRTLAQEKNDDKLEILMLQILSGEVPVIDLDNPSPGDDNDDESEENIVVPDATKSESAECKARGIKFITQAEKMFPTALRWRENIFTTLKQEPANAQEPSESVTNIPENEAPSSQHSVESIEKDMIVTEPNKRPETYNGLPKKQNASEKSEQPTSTMSDCECQVYPDTKSIAVQTETLTKVVEVGTSTDDLPRNSAETQTDAGTLDVVRTCGCRCNCGLMSMAALRANWEMAEKNKDRSCQTDEEINSRFSSKRSKFDLLVGPESPGSESSKRRDRDSSHVRRKTPRSPVEGDPRHHNRHHGVTIKPTELSPRKIAKLQERANRSPRPPGSQKLSTANSNLSMLKIFDGGQKINKQQQNWELTISNPAKFSPQFDAVTKLLKKQGQSAKRRIASPEHPTTPVSPRLLDLSITSVYEYESQESTDTKLQRMKAAKRGLRLFEFKHQQMLSSQRENAERRRERKELRDSKLLTKFSIREIVRPFKRTPQESFIAELVERDEKKALPDSPDYYADRPLRNVEADEDQDEEEEEIEKPQQVQFKGGNCEDDENSQGTQLSVSMCSPPEPSVNGLGVDSQQGFHTPVLRPCSSSIDSTPRSILKSGKGKSRRSTQLKRRSIRWGIQTPELIEKQQKSGASSGDVSLYNPDRSELDGPTPANPYNAYLNVSNFQSAKALHHHQFVTTMCVEVFSLVAETNFKEGVSMPDPQKDQVIAIFYTIHEDDPKGNGSTLGMLAVDVEACTDAPFPFPSWPQLQCSYFPDEISMFNQLLALVRKYDPDILAGYEICKMSWGYLIDRGYVLGIKMVPEMSRLAPQDFKRKQDEAPVEWNEMINGRIVLNLWKLLRHEMTVQSYTFESAMFNIMHEKVAAVSHLTLNKFWFAEVDRYRTVDYFCRRAQGVLEIIDKLDLINRTSELARLFGIQFFEVFSRGSQFRVESMMLRLVKPDDMIAASPTISQRALMRAPTELPLIMEPKSKLFKDPVAVLDFQSLYPSMIIAYNYDFSTCLGRVEHLGSEGRFDLGCLDLQISPVELSRMMAKNEIHISPCGVAFLKSSVKRGILPEMLEQILDTRLMVKRSMKAHSDNKTLQKVLDSRQLGLKLIANVTYGYTSANFSGRMPCVEIADSVVSKGRETLERAIKLIEDNHSRWGAKVIYGDTDSMFVLFPDQTRQKAFELAQEIVDEVTQLNPKPVKLKLEKIYQPCILQTKKRYVGFSYETPQQLEPKYDAKGIETVRRDGCPAVAKILEKSLRILFNTDDEQRVRQYLEAQFQKIMLGNVNLSDFTYAREYRGKGGYRPTAVTPTLTVTERLRNQDRRAEPQAKERVPYVIIFGSPSQTLVSQARTPREFADDESLRINSLYYIEKALIPPLNRCFLLAGIDVHKWWVELPRRNLRLLQYENRQSKGILDYYLVSKNCVSCDQVCDDVICPSCQSSPKVFIKLQREADELARKVYEMAQICEYCSMGVCISLDCQTWQKLLRYDRVQQSRLEVLRRALNQFEHWKT